MSRELHDTVLWHGMNRLCLAITAVGFDVSLYASENLVDTKSKMNSDFGWNLKKSKLVLMNLSIVTKYNQFEHTFFSTASPQACWSHRIAGNKILIIFNSKERSSERKEDQVFDDEFVRRKKEAERIDARWRWEIQSSVTLKREGFRLISNWQFVRRVVEEKSIELIENFSLWNLIVRSTRFKIIERSNLKKRKCSVVKDSSILFDEQSRRWIRKESFDISFLLTSSMLIVQFFNDFLWI